jgi:hypothetical protein
MISMVSMSAKLLVFLVLLATSSFQSSTLALLFREDHFTDMTNQCLDSDGKPLRYILNEDNPAMHVSVDRGHSLKKLKRVERTKLFTKITSNEKSRRMLQDLVEGRKPWLSDVNAIRMAEQHLEVIEELAGSNLKKAKEALEASRNASQFDCVLHFETELPKGDKSGEKYDALSMVIVEFDPSSSTDSSKSSATGLQARVDVITLGHGGFNRKRVTKNAEYSNRLWPGHNPNFLLSGQLSGFDSIDYRTKVDPQHIVKPEHLHSTFDKPASVTVNLSKWSSDSHIYMVITSYKYLRNGERCQENKEFDCSTYSFLTSSQDHMCMNINLACDGLPNCGQDFLPNQDENCFKIHWSSVLLSLVSYILLAITLLLCLSCFARVLIQWSVRSSLAEFRGANTPTGSFRSSSRFFSFLGTTITGRWERPPPTYDEAMKHVNPDLARPQEPPPYNDTVTTTTEHRGSIGNTIDTGRYNIATQQSRNLATQQSRKFATQQSCNFATPQ